MSISRMSGWMKGLFALLAAFVLISISALAQSGTSSVNGTVVDAQGQVVAGATIKLTSTGQGSSRTTTSDGSGAFAFTSVAPGAYSIEVEASGFKRSIIRDVQALVDKATSIGVSLEIGEVTANVEVSAGGIENIVNTQDASLGNNFVSKQISQLPLEGRNVVDLLSLQPGVTADGAVAGGRQDQANITLDGVDVNDQQTGLATPLNAGDPAQAFTAVLRVTPDSVEEFRVTTLSPDATKGRSAGAQISLITKSGSNQFRGNLFEYHRNTLTTANDWYNNAAGIERPKLIRNLFGGSLGGPILKDKLFFFYNYEGMREAKDTGVTAVVPLASLGQGNISFNDQLLDDDGLPVAGYVPVLRTINIATINALTDSQSVTGMTIPILNVNPVALSILADAAARYPSNLGGGDGLNTGGFRFNASLPVKQNTHTARFDWSVTSDQRHQVSLRVSSQQDVIGRTPAFPDTPSADRWSHPMGLSASHTWLISNNLTNRFSYGLTRLAYSDQGDSSENAITFRNIFTPKNFSTTFSRVNPTHNFGDDITWVKGNHTVQFGTNIRIIRNKRTSLASAFDFGTTNFGYYTNSGDDLLIPFNDYLQANIDPNLVVNDGSVSSAQSSLVALLGRINQYTANFVFDIDGNPVNGEPTVREWATEEYDFYVQDSWKLRPSLTLNLGLRYGLSRPVYETQGFQAAPNIGLDEYFRRRQEAAFNGQNYDEPLLIDLAGPVNKKPGFYHLDTNNFQPRVSVAWSPNFKDGWMSKLFGKNNASVLRGGFAITNDYFGQQLAVSFDANNTLGFVSNYTTPPNTFNILDCDDSAICNPAPLLTGLGMNIQNLPGVVPPGQLVFPLQKPQDLSLQIEQSIDSGAQSPVNYTWNVTFGRQLPFKMYFEASYIGRAARHLLATRDVMMPNNLRDPQTGQTYYEAATQLEILKRAGSPLSSVPNNPYWDNLWGAGAIAASILSAPGVECVSPGSTNTQAVYELINNCVGSNDWTNTQFILDRYVGPQLFYQSQYGALSSFGTIAKSNYHGAAFSLRQRMGDLTWDLNYTYAKSLDDTSGLQTSTAYGGAFILNPLRQQDSYAPSDFDYRHVINFNSVWRLPIGKGERWFSGANSFVDAFIGGWQLSSIFRYNTGEPMSSAGRYFDNAGWVTNWNTKSGVVQTRDIETGVFFNGDGGLPTMFADPQEAFTSFRSPFPGETGDRNRLRFPSFVNLDMGLQKQFSMPWKENHKLGIKWEVFNVTNTPSFTGPVSERRLGYKPESRTVPTGFGEFTTTKSNARVMQFALRYDF